MTGCARSKLKVLHPMVFVRDRASVKGRTGIEERQHDSIGNKFVNFLLMRTLGVVKQGHCIQGWPISGRLLFLRFGASGN